MGQLARTLRTNGAGHRRRGRRPRKAFGLESLEPRVVLDASVIISEFVADNEDGLLDEDGDTSDWAELLNLSSDVVDLDGWHLTDNAQNTNKWQLPRVSLGPGEHLVVFASGKDRDNPTRPLHTDFQLNRDGEYLALTRPDESIEFEFAPQYPLQIEDVSYGIPNASTQALLVASGSAARVLVPTDGSLDADPLSEDLTGTWLDPALDTSGPEWFDADLGIGFYDPADDPNPKPGAGTLIADSVDEFSQFQNRDDWRYGYWNKTDDTDGEYDASSSDFKQFVWSGLSTISANNHWDGSMWDLAVAPDPPQTELRADGGHPAGRSTGAEVHHPIRRWTSEVTGSVLIYGRLENTASTGDGVVGRILVDGQTVFSRPVIGGGVDYRVVVAISEGQRVDFVIDPGEGGLEAGDDTVFTARIEDVTSLIGDQGGLPTLAGEIASNIETQMKGVGSTVYVRIPFTPETVEFDALTLNVMYDDAFVAYLNGQPIAAVGGPDSGSAVWNSVADSDRDVQQALSGESFNVTNAIDLLIAGTENVLMIQGINRSVDNDDFLLVPELMGTRLQVQPDQFRYFVDPTPGEANGLGDPTVGPIFLDRDHSPDMPGVSEPLIVTATVAEAFAPIARVDLKYRAMYGSQRSLRMLDDGSGGDVVAGDGVFTATIPGGLAQRGEMIRWYMTAQDAQGQTSRFPHFEDPRDSEEYFGTIIADPSLSSNLPVLHWFVSNRNSAMTRGGTRGSLYYDGEFYDNVQFDLHGQSSGGFPTQKKSMDVDFTRDHRFRWSDDIPRMKDFNLLTNFADKAKVRNTLAYEQRQLIGDAYHLAYPVRVQHNGDFFAVYDFVEDGDDRWLERMGFDPDGALYKMYNSMDSATGEKKTRRDEGNADLQALVSGVRLSGQARADYIYDNINLAAMANYLAGFVITSNRDCCHKNYYAYRDTNGTGEWQYMAWDVDLSQGRNWGGFGLAYFDDTMYPNNALYMGGNNRLISALYATPGFREMYLRRVRTVMDQYVKPPGTPYDQLPLETRVDELVQLMSADAALDNQRHRATWGQTRYQSFQEANDILKNEYAGPRRSFLYDTQVVPDHSDLQVIVSGEPGETLARYFVPTNNGLGNSWTQLEFNDSDWSEGLTGLGFEKSPPGFNDLLRTDLSTAMEGQKSVYLRVPFQLDSLEDFQRLTLRMKYDDGFIAYLNGTEVARRRVSGAVSYDMNASSHSDSQAVVFEDIDISSFVNRLRVGDNVLAIQAVNQSATSSDFLILPELAEGFVSQGDGEIPLAQVGHPSIDLGAIDFNPISGNQDEEYLELVNSNDVAVDVSGWQLTGAVDWQFPAGTVLPSEWSLYVTPNAQAFRARTTGPSGGQGLFVQGNYDGHLSNFGETIELLAEDGSLLSTWTYEGDPTDVQQHLRITEIMYHPLPPSAAELAVNSSWTDEDFEFIELTNTSTDVTLDLSGVRFSDGVVFDFAPEPATTLAPQQRLLVVKSPSAFEARYGNDLSSQIVGEFRLASGLRDSGEVIKLEDATQSTVVQFAYADDPDERWPARADGLGSSLQLVDADADPAEPESWQPSVRIHGSPGAIDTEIVPQIVISELLSRPVSLQLDMIELHNAGSTAVAMQDFYLSDDAAESLVKFRLPNVVLEPGEFLVFDERDFNAGGLDDPDSFGLSGTHGDQLFLTAGGADGPVDFVDHVTFPGAVAGESFGRNTHTVGGMAPLWSQSFGMANGAFRVGPVVISEVQSHPSEPTEAALVIDPELSADDLEFIEIHNPTVAVVPLAGWRMRGDVDHDFLPDDVLGPGETALIVPFNPQRDDNASRVAAFRAHYEMDETVRLWGGYPGELNNAGERITLQQPDTPTPDEPEFIPRLLEDEVWYDDAAPWPETADGQGHSLQRIRATAVGSDPVAWQAAAPTPGRVEFTVTLPADFNADGQLDAADIALFCQQLHNPAPLPAYDLNQDGLVNAADRDQLIFQEFDSTYGDANLDGAFDSSDLVVVFVVGEYEDDVAGNSTWREGDWNCDGEFDTGDLILAFVTGDYEAPAAQSVEAAAVDHAVGQSEVAGALLMPQHPGPSESQRRGLAVRSPASAERAAQSAPSQELFARDTVFATLFGSHRRHIHRRATSAELCDSATLRLDLLREAAAVPREFGF